MFNYFFAFHPEQLFGVHCARCHATVEIERRLRNDWAGRPASQLFDRTRECYLLTVGRMQALGAGAGGRILARGEVVAVTGRDSLWVFRAR